VTAARNARTDEAYEYTVTAVSGSTDVARKTRMRRVRTLMSSPEAPERFDGELHKYVRLAARAGWISGISKRGARMARARDEQRRWARTPMSC
jgi:hypothetical protein